MLKLRLPVLALAASSALFAHSSQALTLQEDFSSDPAARGWQVFGDANLFQWDAVNGDLEVTWDSSHPNSYFYYSLGMQVTRNDDFSAEFDLRLSDIASGNEDGKPAPLEIGFGFLNSSVVTNADFTRSTWGGAPNVAEFNYYPSGYFDLGGGFLWPISATTAASFISGVNSTHYGLASLFAYEFELPTNQPIHVRFAYSAFSQSAAITVTTNGVPLGPLPDVVLDGPNSQFTAEDNFYVDMFSISSYTSGNDVYSVLGHGLVDNLVVTATRVPVSRIAGSFTGGGGWQAQFFTHTNWLYTLERTTDFKSWAPVSITLRGTEDVMTLQDTNSLPASAFYRVRADYP